MYQLTINAPEEKGWTHEHILEVMRGNSKLLSIFAWQMSREAVIIRISLLYLHPELDSAW